MKSEPTESERDERLRNIYGGTPLRSRQSFRRRKLMFVAYALLWAASLIFALSLVGGLWMWVVWTPFMLVLPSIDGFTTSYEDYRAEWERGNPEQREQAPTPDAASEAATDG